MSERKYKLLLKAACGIFIETQQSHSADEEVAQWFYIRYKNNTH
jgi:hypothetical protein